MDYNRICVGELLYVLDPFQFWSAWRTQIARSNRPVSKEDAKILAVLPTRAKNIKIARSRNINQSASKVRFVTIRSAVLVNIGTLGVCRKYPKIFYGKSSDIWMRLSWAEGS